MAQRHVLVVEDNADIAQLLELHLCGIGCSVRRVADGEAALVAAQREPYDLVVLDLMLPGIDGLEVCRRLRAQGDDPAILMLTARSSELDRVLGLELGADDYLAKPFSVLEFAARAKALLRRAGRAAGADAGPPVLRVGSLVIDTARREVRDGERRIDLTAKEFDLLAHFARSPGRVMSRMQLLEHVWGYSHSGYEHTVNSHINRLRAKIERDPNRPELIQTVWGVGYRCRDAREIRPGRRRAGLNMLRTLSGRLALLLSPLFVAGGALLAGLWLRMPGLQDVVAAGGALLAIAVAFALAAALLVFRLLTRRLQRLAQAIAAFRDANFREPVQLPWADPDGDEIDRLASDFVQMAAHMSRQIDELESHDRQRRELLANVSHDLRTPLALMQGYLETLLLQAHGSDPRAQRAYLEVATRHAERMGRLVGELFELAKLDGAAPQIACETFALTELVQDVAQKFALPARSRDVSIETRIDADTPPVHADIGLIERALENLIENALRHTPEGGTVAVDVEPGGERVHVRVRDTGCGIDAQHLPHVFDRYFRAPRVETGAPDAAAGGHAGLGLAIAQRIVALHGGRIQVFSHPGAGAAFTFDVPAATAVH